MPTETLKPNAAGDVTQLTIAGDYPPTYNWQCVDDTSPNGYADYVYNATFPNSSKYDLYNLPSHSVGSGTINFIKVHINAWMSYGDGNCKARVKIKTGGSEYDNGSDIDLTDHPADYSHQWNTNPKTSAAWTWDNIDALQIGVACVNYTSRSTYCTQAYVGIDYTEGGEEYSESAAISVGIATTAERSATTTRAAAISVAIAPLVRAGRAIYALVSVGAAVVASRHSGVSRAASILTGIATTATRAAALTRAAAISTGITTLASYTLGHGVAAIIGIGIAITAARRTATSRTVSISVGVATTATRTLSAIRTALIKLGSAVTATRLGTIARSAAINVGQAVVVTWALVETPRIRLKALTLKVRSLALTLIKRGVQ